MKTIDLTKYFPKSALGIYVVAGFFVFGLTFLFSLLASRDVFISLILSAAITIFGIVVAIVNDNLGEKRHKRILNSDAFLSLIQNGFKVEEINRYYGLTGIYRNYLVDIHYNWATHVNSNLVRAIVINVYFDPPLLNDSNIDEQAIQKISERIDRSKKLLDKYSFAWRERTLIMSHKVGYLNPSPQKLTKWIDIAVDALISENLKPIDRKSLLTYRSRQPDLNVPEIELYFPLNP